MNDRCRFCNGWSTNMVEHEENCVLRPVNETEPKNDVCSQCGAVKSLCALHDLRERHANQS